MFGLLNNMAYFFEDHNLTYNSHTYGVDPSKFKSDPNLRSMFEVTSVSYLPEIHKPFVASIESKKYPFFGT